MSTFDGMLLKEAIPVAKGLYESFGLRSLILFKDDDWTNLVTVISLSRRTVQDLGEEYRFLKERLGELGNADLRSID